MKKNHYDIVIIPAAICTVLLSLIAFYATGLIDKSTAKEVIQSRIDIVCEDIEYKKEYSDELNQQIYSNYCSKARAIALLLNRNRQIFSDESAFEEMRVAIGADVISISDETGTIVYSTDLDIEEHKVAEEFMSAVENKVYSGALLSERGGEKIILTGSSRIDESGVIQIEFPLDTYQQQLDAADISLTVSKMPLLKMGSMAVIDLESWTYLSHTDSFLKDSHVQFDIENFSEEADSFSSRYLGEKVYVLYQKYDDNTIVAGIIPYSEIYQRRNTVVKWLIFSMIATTFVVILSVRNHILIVRKHKGDENA